MSAHEGDLAHEQQAPHEHTAHVDLPEARRRTKLFCLIENISIFNAVRIFPIEMV